MHKWFVGTGLVLCTSVLLSACEQPTASADDLDARLAVGQALEGPGLRGAERGGRSPLARLIAQAETLGLSSDQVAALERIRGDLEAANAPLFDQVRQILGDPPQRPSRDSIAALSETERVALREKLRAEMEARREERQAKMEQARPLLDEIRDNTRNAAEQALALLTDEQRAKLEAEQARRREEMEGRRGDGGGADRPWGRGGRGGRSGGNRGGAAGGTP